MKKRFLILLLVSIIPALLLTGCRCPSCVAQEEAIIPNALLEKANEVVIAKTGEDFFNKYIQPAFGKIKHVPPHYQVVYDLVMPEKPYVQEQISITINDSTGALVPDVDVVGIPDCKSNECNFNIDEAQALEIAKVNGLEEGIKPWKKAFTWNAKYQQYVWQILNTIKGSESSEGFRGSGREIIIDPNSGLVLELNDWFIR